jgi:predicted transcriptional regulator
MRMEAAAKKINVRLDGEHARKLAELAAERHVEEVELAGEVLAGALDDFGMDGARMTAILDGIPGAWERTQEGLEQARRGEGVPLDDLI